MSCVEPVDGNECYNRGVADGAASVACSTKFTFDKDIKYDVTKYKIIKGETGVTIKQKDMESIYDVVKYLKSKPKTRERDLLISLLSVGMSLVTKIEL